MKQYINGQYVELTEEEKAAIRAAEDAFWAEVDYDTAVNAQIRERYTVSQEFAILRQQMEKPEEYAAYYAYCESCKAFVKTRKGMA